MVLASAKVELARVQKERDEARSGRDAATWGAATAAREMDEARAEKDVVHAKAREARDAARKGWDNLVTLVEEERAAILEERRAWSIKLWRQQWQRGRGGRAGSGQRRMGGRPQLPLLLLWGVMPSWGRQVQGPAQGRDCRGQGERGGKGMRHGGHDLKREQDTLAAKGSLLRTYTAEIASKLMRE